MPVAKSPLDDEIYDKALTVGCKAIWVKGIFGYAWHCGCDDGYHASDSQCSMLTMKSLSRKRPKPKPQYRKFKVRITWSLEGNSLEVWRDVGLVEGSYLGGHGSADEGYRLLEYIRENYSPELDIRYEEIS